MTRYCTVLFVLIGLLILGNETKAQVSFPFDYQRTVQPWLIIHVRINGSQPIPLMFDTGCAFPVIITKKYADKLKFKGNGKTFTFNNDRVKAECADIDGLTIEGKQDGIKFPQKQVVIADTVIPEYSVPIAGAVGLSLFTEKNVQIDFAAKEVRLFPQTEKLNYSKDAFIVKIQTSSNLYTIPVKTNKEVNLLFGIDTGTEWTSIPEVASSVFDWIPTLHVYYHRWTAGSESDGVLRYMKAFQISHYQDKQIVAVFPGEEPASIGTDFLSQFRVTFDLAEENLILEPSSQSDKRIRGMKAVELEKVKNKFVIWDMVANSTAAKSGLKIGDVLTKVDGKEIRDLPAATVQNLLDGYADTKALVTIVHSGKKEVTVSYLRQNLFAMVNGRRAGIGFAAEYRVPGGLTITEIVPGSPAEKAGLQVGDEIVKIGEAKIEDLPVPQIEKRVGQREGGFVSLTYRSHKTGSVKQVKLRVSRY